MKTLTLYSLCYRIPSIRIEKLSFIVFYFCIVDAIRNFSCNFLTSFYRLLLPFDMPITVILLLLLFFYSLPKNLISAVFAHGFFGGRIDECLVMLCLWPILVSLQAIQ